MAGANDDVWRQRFDDMMRRLEELSGLITDIDQQQRTQTLAINRLENGARAPSSRFDDLSDVGDRNGGRFAHHNVGRGDRYGRGGDGFHGHGRPGGHRFDGDGDRPPRYHKLDFPKFDGRGDPLPFLNRCEQFFRGQRTPEDNKVWLASYHLLDGAQQWYTRLERDHEPPSWHRFSELLNMRYGPPLHSTPLGELAACRRTTTVDDYAERFLDLLTRTGYLSEDQQLGEDDTDNDSATDQADAAATLRISLHAATGVRASDAMHITAHLGDTDLYTLIDSGLMHTFLSQDTAARVGRAPQPRMGLNVTVANGDKVACPGVFPDMPLQIAGEEFATDVYDFTVLTMSFWHRVTLHGLPGHQRPRALACAPAALLDSLLEEFADVFTEPTGLPPARDRSHRIQLLPGTAPVAVRPYRYPVRHKDELERQCRVMEENGLIHRSTSAFSSPVLLVKKADGSWRFCVNYRALNERTVKDKYPIPVVDELLDELHGAAIFSKLDLRSGYHQVRMHPDDIDKTAFRTHDGLYEFLVIPFGLTNALATFQSLMNDVLRPFLRRFVLVFFDDILVYSPTWTSHLQHLRTVFTALWAAQLFVKHTKCSFGDPSVAYLGHIISQHGFAMDAAKIQAVAEWPRPRSPKELRGFLGLASYYRKFIQDFGSVAAPLTQLLRKDSFAWAPATDDAFQRLKLALTTTPVLSLPDFNRPFVVECDASGTGFGAVLHQGEDPIAYFSRPIATRHHALAAYERELISLVQAVRHWRPYLWGRQFIVKTDHYSLKFLLDQRLSTIPQHHWVSKLLGFDFVVEYKPGKQNAAADALSCRAAPDSQAFVLSTPTFDLLKDIRTAGDTDPALQALRDEINSGTRTTPWAVIDGLVTYKRRIYIPPGSPWVSVVVAAAHDDGHEGIQKTLHRLRRDFHTPDDRRVVHDHIQGCLTCQRNKTDHLHPAGLLLPLPVPSAIWSDVAMDFVEGLPRVGGKSVILTVVDRFSKYAHLIALAHSYTAETVARAFFVDIVRLHGVPESIVSDRDPVFTSAFWTALFTATCTKLHRSTAFHPQSDGQSKAVNKAIAMCLRCMTGDRSRQWLRWLPWAEYIYNTSFHAALRDTPFKLVYGRDPPSIRAYDASELRVAAVAQSIEERDAFLADVRLRLEQAQQYAKRYYDQKHREVSFEVGAWVWLRVRHRVPASLPEAVKGKLRPRFYGPYRVVAVINEVAYRLALPPGTRLHDVFHVGLLKPFVGVSPSAPLALPPIQHGAAQPVPRQVLRARLARGVRQLLVQWEGLPASATSWEDLDDFRNRYPSFQLADELLIEGGRDVMWGIPFRRRKQQAGLGAGRAIGPGGTAV
uniref:Gag-pol polyprotein n=1 Tax=Oryza sativa subsp. japonica TaxID=39947 RepID=Q8RUU3_ORYSJ|nr:retrotransposon protein, putative, unclassified [Oryza sativa Japonica Group]AAM18147.1 Putative gag-pol polyprotein [Oryza sativa Japonica Group]